MKSSHSLLLAACIAGLSLLASCASAPKRITAPLRASPENPRYFVDGAGRPVYLTGAHTWNSLVDMGRNDPPEKFDFDAYLAFLERYNHNFIRLWMWDSTRWDTRSNRPQGKEYVHIAAPLPYARTGPGLALDGKPKFDLAKYNPEFFARLRSRVEAAGRRGIYVSVMLFEGWGLYHGNRRSERGWAWRSHPYHPDNNINGINPTRGTDGRYGDVHKLTHRNVNALQAAYIRHVIDTLNDLDNVLFEVANEGGEKDWNWWVVQTFKEYERTKPKQHPIGITAHGAERLTTMVVSPADWVSPGRDDGYGDDPPAWEAGKVSLLDTDHNRGIGGDAVWAWKAFTRGHNPLFMDPYDGAILGQPFDPKWEPVRTAIGHTRRYADRMDLLATKPMATLASTSYCLANPGKEYVVYQPNAKEPFTVELPTGTYTFEWFNPTTGLAAGAGTLTAPGSRHSFTAPFDTHAVLYLRAR